MSKVTRPKSNNEAKQRRMRIARKRWRKPALAAMASGDGSRPQGVDRMLAEELSIARGHTKPPQSQTPS